MSGANIKEQDAVFGRHWDDDAAWAARLSQDREWAARRQTSKLRALTDETLARSRAAGAVSFVLTGSTALERRTKLSDLDFYVVGPRPALPSTDEDLDVYAVDLAGFKHRLAKGDDYLHWTLRFGLILYDAGPLRWALGRTADDNLWPDVTAKAVQARRAVGMAIEILATGDGDAAVEQCRIAFSLAARWWLLESGEFPRARMDLPEQLAQTPLSWLGEALRSTISDEASRPHLPEVAAELKDLLDQTCHGIAPSAGISVR